ncbi:hypothetical protein KCU77_g1223, partial [Aureobasidium melanogenum]
MLAEAFEKDAAARELEIDDTFRRVYGREPLKFTTESPEFERKEDRPAPSFKGLDLTNIPATPDSLLDSPLGLEMFLRAGRNPMSAIGPNPGPTEREYRERDTSNPPTAPILSEEEQWALFTEDKCLPYSQLLVGEYTRRVEAKANVDKAKTPDASDKKESSTGDWPDVEGHDWVTLPSWKKQKEDQRAAMIERLSKWNFSDATAAGFDDDFSRCGYPRKYWPYSKSLSEMEAEEAPKHH